MQVEPQRATYKIVEGTTRDLPDIEAFLATLNLTLMAPARELVA
jgi:hypothetical protein